MKLSEQIEELITKIYECDIEPGEIISELESFKEAAEDLEEDIEDLKQAR